MKDFKNSVLSLIIQTTSNLPADVRKALNIATFQGPKDQTLCQICSNINISCDSSSAICQDTGLPTFVVCCPIGCDQLALEADIRSAVEEATLQGFLRPNSVDTLSNRNTGNNLSPSTPTITFKQWQQSDIEVKLLLKGGGSENQSAQYSLPCQLEHLGQANRDLEGVKKCVLHAIWKAQGEGCAPGFIGVAIGADRAGGYSFAKHQLFRDCFDTNPVHELAKLEKEILEQANQLDIGTMGLGSGQTLLGCKIGAYNRLPASYFVSVSYNCWAFRRLGIIIDTSTGSIKEWQYLDQNPEPLKPKNALNNDISKAIRLKTPLTEADVKSLKLGDYVLLSGKIITARDAAHKYLMSHPAPVNLQGAALYHCGPVVRQIDQDSWQVLAAGPTTSIREEPYESIIIEKFGVKAIIGKGGMGIATLDALKQHTAVYLHAVGGAAQIYAKSIQKVDNVYLLDMFGTPEAMWELEVKDFPVVVTMDCHGNSLHETIKTKSAERLKTLI